MGPPQVGGEIGPFGLVGSWNGYRVFNKKNDVCGPLNRSHISFIE